MVFRVDHISGELTIVAGNGSQFYYPSDGVPATSTGLNQPSGLAFDNAGNLYISDTGNNEVRRVDAAGIITTVAGDGGDCAADTDGFGDGCLARLAILNQPTGLAFDSSGDLYVADSYNRIRRVDSVTGVITTVAGGGRQSCTGNSSFLGDGGPATSASLCGPWGLAVDPAGNLFIADTFDYSIRRVDAVTGIITTVAGNLFTHGFNGDGIRATLAGLNAPHGVALDSSGDLLIADTSDSRIRRVDASTGVITRVTGFGSGCAEQTDSVGDGCPAADATVNFPDAVALDVNGDLFVADTGNNRTREVNAASGIINTVAGNGVNYVNGDGAPAINALLFGTIGLGVDRTGNLFVVDAVDGRIRRVDAVTGTTSTMAGGGRAARPRPTPSGTAVRQRVPALCR